MKWILGILVAALVAAIFFCVWRWLMDPTFVSALIISVIGSLGGALPIALKFIFKRKSPEEEKLDHEAARRGRLGRSTRFNPHSGDR